MSKKLLSVLVVLALALSMVPVVGLPATKAEATTFNNANLVDADTATAGMQAVCPHCAANGDSAVKTWTPVPSSGDPRIGYKSNAGHLHYYLAGPLTGSATGRFMELGGNTVICLHLNGKNMSYGSVMMIGAGTTLNVMGNGEVTFLGQGTSATNKDYGMYLNGTAASNATVNIYGGIWKLGTGVAAKGAYIVRGNLTVSGDAKFESEIEAPNAAVASNGAPASAIILKENATADKLRITNGVLTVDGSWTGTANLVNDKTTYPTWSATGKYTGVLTLDTDGIGTGTTRGRIVTNDGSSLILGRATIGDTWYNTLGLAVTAYTAQNFTDGAVIKSYCLAGSALPTVAGQSYYIDLNGFNASAVSGAGTVYLLDSANDTYDAAKCGVATKDANSTVTIATDANVGGKRYIAIEDNGTYTAHRLDMAINTVTLKTSVAGLYFKASYKCDTALAAEVDAYGVYVSKSSDMSNAGYSALEGFAANMTNNTVTGNSGAVVDILKVGADDNLGRAATAIYAKSYIKIGDDVYMGTENIGCSLKTVLQAIDTNWTAFADKQDKVETFLADWSMKDATVTAAALGLTNIGN